MTTSNWLLAVILMCLALPGVYIAMPRLINLLLPDNSSLIKKRISWIVIIQTLVMVLLMSIVGTVLAPRTGLGDPIMDAIIGGRPFAHLPGSLVLPIAFYTLIGLAGFLFLYYGVVAKKLDGNTLRIMKKMRAAVGLDGCVLYGGVVEEIIARWGLMNVLVFFAMLFTGQHNSLLTVSAMLVSGLIFSMGHLPAYIAAGCQRSRRFTYSMLLLNTWQTLLFGFLFWQYGLIAAMMTHMLFHLGWYYYDKP